MNVMICFDVSGKQAQVKEALASLGYMSSWKISRGHDEITFNLPANAMWKKGENMSPAKAKEDLKKAVKEAGVKTIRAIALTIGKWDGVTGSAGDSSGHEE
jgi:hypothetical protein